jgi:hypothetical protein
MPWRRVPSFLLLAVLLLPLSVRGQDDPIEARMRADITYLASDECEGRGIETKGINLAAGHIAHHFAKAGLQPGGVNATFFQPFTVSIGVPKLDNPGKVTLKGPLGQQIELKPGTDFQVFGFSGSGNVTAPLVFAGYGATAKDIGYDDYQGIDVAGKIVVALRKTPRYNSSELPFDGPRKDEHAALDRKQAVAEANRAAAVIVVNDMTESPGGDKLTNFNDLSRTTTPGGIPAVHMRRSLLEMIFQSALGTSIRDVELAIDRDMKNRSAPLKGWTATVETAVNRPTTPVKNVIGVLEGNGPLAKETIVIGAHYDHLGFGGRGSLAKGGGKGQIHHGADDNGSGTTAVIELARRFGAIKDRQGRRLVFMTFSAEESGLLGSRHYCVKEPLFALEDTAAMVNLDMVGRLRPDKNTGQDRLIVEGVGSSKGFEELIDKLNPGFTFTKRPNSGPYSDQHSFYLKRIPVLFFWTDTHEDYHRPTDTADRINVAGMRKITDFAEKVIAHLATVEKRPEYIQVAGGGKMGTSGAPKGPRLGFMPSYDEDKKGVRIDALSAGGAAEKAGLKEGDLIVEISGKSVSSVQTYMAIMAQQKAGQAIDVVILRGEKKMTVKVTPQ